VVAPDAASATPQIIAAVEAQGGSVTSIHESRPSFDEVFARLVRRAERDVGDEGRPEDGDSTKDGNRATEPDAA
jgi:hypothetical protein